MRRSSPIIPRKRMDIIVKYSTIWKLCVSITEIKLYLYAVMKLAVLASRYAPANKP